MTANFVIELKDLRLFGVHGMYQEEVRVGNEYNVSVRMEKRAPAEVIHSLSDTIDYVEVYRIIQEIFSVRKHLLETIAMEISEGLYLAFPDMVSMSITIEKLAAPLTNFSGNVRVTYVKSFE